MTTRQDPEQIEARRAVAALLVRAGMKGNILDYGPMDMGEENARGVPLHMNVRIYPNGEVRDYGPDFIPWNSVMLQHFINHVGEAVRCTEEVRERARCEARKVNDLAAKINQMEVD